MNILLTAATENELLVAKQAGINSSHQTTCVITGIGATATAYHTLKQLQNASYDLLINIGIAGSFTDRLPVGSIALVKKEYFGDLGVQSPAGFSGLFDEQLLRADTFPFTKDALVCPYTDTAIAKIPDSILRATGVTVQTASGQLSRISELRERYAADIETMESAAFFYVCLYEKIPFLALRAISNKVEPRDKSQWDIPLALQNLKIALKEILRA